VKCDNKDTFNSFHFSKFDEVLLEPSQRYKLRNTRYRTDIGFHKNGNYYGVAEATEEEV